MLLHPLQNMDRLQFMAFEIPKDGLTRTEQLKNCFVKNGFFTVPLSADTRIPSFTEEGARDQIEKLLANGPPTKKVRRANETVQEETKAANSRRSRVNQKKVTEDCFKESPVFYYRGPHPDQQECVNVAKLNQALGKEGLFFEENALFDMNRSQYTFDHLIRKIPKPPDFMIDVQQILRENIPKFRTKPEDREKMTLENMNLFAVLKSKPNAKLQGLHIDHVHDGLVAMVSADGQPFKIGVCPGSHKLVKRIKELREIWLDMRRKGQTSLSLNYEVSYLHASE